VIATAFRLALRNLWRRKARSGIALLGVAAGTGVLVFLWGFNDGAHAAMRRNLEETIVGSLQVHAAGWFSSPQLHRWISAPESVISRIRALRPDALIALRVHGFALAAGTKDTGLGVAVLGVQPEEEARLSRLDEKVGVGRWLSASDAQQVIVGKGTAQALGVSVGDAIALLAEDRFGALVAERFEVVGIITSGERGIDRGLVIVPIQAAKALFSLEKEVHEVVVLLPSDAGLAALDAALEQSLGPQGLEVLRWDEMYPVMQQWIEIDDAFMRLFLLVVLVIVAASVGNAALMSAIERRREFALLAALGARPYLIGAMVLVEGSLLAVLGSALGAALGLVAIAIAAERGIDLSGELDVFARFYFEPIVRPRIELAHLGETLFVVWAACALAAYLPARAAARTRPAEGLVA